MSRLVLATTNRGKVRELAGLLGGTPIRLETLADHPGMPAVVEDGDTFAANARLKARAVCAFTGAPALADDSGLVVDALDGAPGIRSARYAGDGATDAENRGRLRAALAELAGERWPARFVAALALALPDGRLLEAEGRCEGWVVRAERGQGGFGYDPMFIPGAGAATLAELGAEEKNALSHRGAAIRALLPQILAALQG